MRAAIRIRARVARRAGAAAIALLTCATIPSHAAQPTAAWQLDDHHLNATAAWQSSRGFGVVVAVVDSGVAADHPDLAGRVLPGAGFVGVAGDTGTADLASDSHGTAIAGLIAGRNVAPDGTGVQGLAPDAKILPVRVTLDTTVEAGALAQGIAWAADHGAKVVNVSFSTPDPDPALRAAVTYAQSKDCVVVASAGNTGAESNEPMYPASFPGVVSVSGTDRAGAFWVHSQSGPRTAIAAPAVDIYSSNNKGQYVRAEGTSYSAAYVSAAAALVRAKYPELTAAQTIRQLVSTAKSTGSRSPNARFGYGQLDPVTALTKAPDRTQTTNPLLAATDFGDGDGFPVLPAVVGGVVLAGAAGSGAWWWRRRRIALRKAAEERGRQQRESASGKRKTSPSAGSGRTARGGARKPGPGKPRVAGRGRNARR